MFLKFCSTGVISLCRPIHVDLSRTVSRSLSPGPTQSPNQPGPESTQSEPTQINLEPVQSRPSPVPGQPRPELVPSWANPFPSPCYSSRTMPCALRSFRPPQAPEVPVTVHWSRRSSSRYVLLLAATLHHASRFRTRCRACGPPRVLLVAPTRPTRGHDRVCGLCRKCGCTVSIFLL